MSGNNDKEVQILIEDPNFDGWQQGKALDACLVEMFDRSLWTDIKFRCNDHEESGFIKAHKTVIAARSPVFQAMFFGACADGKDEVEVKTTQSETFRLFLRYLYCDIITLKEETAIAVLELAHLYQVSSLVQYCAVYLSTVITSRNVCRILTCAMLYELTSLKTLCCSFIDNNAEEVLKSDAFMELSADCLLYVLKGDTLHAEEESILDAAENWSRKKVIEKGIEATGPNIRTCLGESFYQLRLPTMTSKSLMECISRKGYFSVEEYADIAAFLGKVSEVSISTNSCIERVPEKESILVNTNYRCQPPNSSLTREFEISVTKDCAMSGIVLCGMTPFLKCKEKAYVSNENCYPNENGLFNGVINLSKFNGKVIKVRRISSQYDIDILKTLEGIDIPSKLELVMSGSIVIECLNFRHNFTLQQAQYENGRVSFQPPLVLKKRQSPFRLEMNLKYNYEDEIKIKTEPSGNSYLPDKRITGHIQIRNLSDYFSGVKCFEFLNFSNRDSCAETETEAAMESNEEVHTTFSVYRGILVEDMSEGPASVPQLEHEIPEHSGY